MTSKLQLAHTYKSFPRGTSHVLVEPKLDGYRLAAFIKGSGPSARVIFETRQGNREPFTTNLKFIGDQLLKMGFRDGMLVDGEIIVKDWNSTGLVKRKSLSPADRAKLEATAVYWVFDVVDGDAPQPLEVRRSSISGKVGRGSKNVKLVPQYTARNDEDVQRLFRKFLAEGYEGAIVKLPGTRYEKRRSTSWLKIKQHKTFDVKITGREEGTGRLRGSLGALVGVLRNGKKVKMGTGLTDALRAKLWRMPLRDLVGQWVEVKSQKSDVSDARHPVFVRFREDLNMKRSAKGAKTKHAQKPLPVGPITQVGFGKLVSQQAAQVAQLRLGYAGDMPIVRIGSVLVSPFQKKAADFAHGRYKNRKATQIEMKIASRTLGNRPSIRIKSVAKRAASNISDREIRRKYESCVSKVKDKMGAGAYGICTQTLRKTYGKARVDKALVPVRKKAAKDAAKTRAAKRRNPSQRRFQFLQMFGAMYGRGGKKALAALEKKNVENFQLTVGKSSGNLMVWFADSREIKHSTDPDISRYMRYMPSDDAWMLEFDGNHHEYGSNFVVDLPDNFVCKHFQMQMLLPTMRIVSFSMTSEWIEVETSWANRVEALSEFRTRGASREGVIQTYHDELVQVR